MQNKDIVDKELDRLQAELFDLDHHALNRHDRRAIKAKYRKLRKK